MRKSDGSILIEVMASILILSISSVFALSSTLKCLREYERRIKIEKINRTVNMIISELKYNVTQSEFDNMLGGSNELSFKYDDDISERLYDSGVGSLIEGEEIKIKKISSDQKRCFCEVQVIAEENIEMDYKFYKSWWMNEV